MKSFFSPIRKKLQNQLIIVFVSLSIIMTAILVSVSYYIFSVYSRENYIENSSLLLNQLSTYVSSYFNAIDQSTMQIYSDVMLSPEYYTSESDSPIPYNHILKELQNIYLQDISTHSICLYLAENEELYIVNQYSNYSINISKSLLNSDSIQQISDSNSMLISHNGFQNIFPKEIQFDEEENLLTFSRSIKINNQTVAYLFINYITDSLCETLSQNINENSSILLCDLSGNYVASSHPNITDFAPSLLQMADKIQGTFQTGQGRKAELYLYQKLEDYPLMLVKQMPLHTLLQEAHSMRTSLLLLALGFIIIVIIVIIRISYYMTSRIVTLKNCINTVADGNFNIHPTIKGEDEISDISKAFIEMDIKIQKLIQEKYIAELSSQRATINALNAQINPHFLYNTLQTISSIAHEENVPDIEIMIKSLANMMRYSIKPAENAAEQTVTVSQELENCKNYLKLLSYRYTDRLLYNIQTAPEAENILIPRLSLQPLIENAIIHGIDENVNPCILLIKVYIQNATCILSVSDNGKGISASKLSEILQNLTANTPSSHLGLQNVYMRFQLMYKNSFKFEISSILYRKTCVQISISAPKQKEMV